MKKREHKNSSRGKCLRNILRRMISWCMFIVLPLIPTFAAVIIWRFVFFEYSICFHGIESTHILIGSAASCFIIFGFWAQETLKWVKKKYYEIEMSDKCADLEKFLNLKDARIPRRDHIVIGTMWCGTLISLMVTDYPYFYLGVVVISLATYLPSIMFFNAKEMDNPFKGFWKIEMIHKAWMGLNEKDIKEFREERWNERAKGYIGALKIIAEKINIKTTGEVEIDGPVSLVTTEPPSKTT